MDEVEVAMFKHFFFIQNKHWTGTHIQFQVGGSSKVALYSGLEFKVKAPNLIVLCSFSSAETRLQKKSIGNCDRDNNSIRRGLF